MDTRYKIFADPPWRSLQSRNHFSWTGTARSPILLSL